MLKNKAMSVFRILIVFMLWFALSGCGPSGAILSGAKPLAPKVTLQKIKLVKLGLSEQVYRLKLQVNNPNQFELPLKSLNYQLFINDKSFAHGLTDKSVTIPALGTGYLETDVKTNIADVLEGWQQWLSAAKRSLDYKISGEINLSNFWLPLPFEYADKVDLLLTK